MRNLISTVFAVFARCQNYLKRLYYIVFVFLNYWGNILKKLKTNYYQLELQVDRRTLGGMFGFVRRRNPGAPNLLRSRAQRNQGTMSLCTQYNNKIRIGMLIASLVFFKKENFILKLFLNKNLSNKVDDIICSTLIGAKVHTYEPCNNHQCPRWFPGPWSQVTR